MPPQSVAALPGHAHRYNMNMTTQPPRSVADIEGFVGLLRAACDDPQIKPTLERLPAMPDAQRPGVVHSWVSDLIIAEAPCELIEAVGCLLDDAVAKQACAVIYQCRRERIDNDRASHV